MPEEITLRVAEAYHRDAGRGIARIDIKDMDNLGVVSGDIIEIHGKQTAAAIIWPGYPEDGEGIIRIDGNIRSNVGVGIGDKIGIRRVEAKHAKSLIIAPTQPVRIVGGEQYLARVLDGRPVFKGQKMRIDLMPGNPLTFIITGTRPAGTVICTKNTEIVLKEKPVEEGRLVPQIAYEDIGGLKREIALVREMIELPLRHPELFQKLGIEPPKGILLHGPPGTGKTLIAKAVASETDANFTHISGPEIMSKYYGESEQRLREVFEEAREDAPSIIFIDEIDSIAPKREEVTGEVERRVVAQLLSLMDGLEARGEVIVIAATNRPNAIDEALRRGGRFDREIEIGIPDRTGRLEVLQVHTRGMPLAEEVDLKEIADITHGFVGADMAALCKEAAMHALRRILPEIDIEEEIPPEIMEKLQITRGDFYEALKNIEPSALREVFVEVPHVEWNDVGGLDEVKQEIIEAVEWPLKYHEAFEEINITPPKGILLHGPPGTGKTLLAKAIANKSESNFISIKGPELLSKYVGESEKAVRETFRKAKQAAPTIIFFDEIDAITPIRGGSFGDSHVTERVVSQILTELDGLEELKDVIVIAATNRPDMIDPALLRPGRIDKLIYVPPPNEDARKDIFAVHLKGKPIDGNVNLNSLAEATEGYVGADIEAICRGASMLALKEIIQSNMGQKAVKDGVKRIKIKKEHFDEAMKQIKASAEKVTFKKGVDKI
ncbi:MAG: CDC48 family AAA ATPase [Methanosarcinales archaeon Met12]|nr:MAG: CDC48 family AAA ATPase [Methanosarcinales archaeon Met12]